MYQLIRDAKMVFLDRRKWSGCGLRGKGRGEVFEHKGVFGRRLGPHVFCCQTFSGAMVTSSLSFAHFICLCNTDGSRVYWSFKSIFSGPMLPHVLCCDESTVFISNDNIYNLLLQVHPTTRCSNCIVTGTLFL